jgi:hypothetical protein
MLLPFLACAACLIAAPAVAADAVTVRETVIHEAVADPSLPRVPYSRVGPDTPTHDFAFESFSSKPWFAVTARTGRLLAVSARAARQ